MAQGARPFGQRSPIWRLWGKAAVSLGFVLQLLTLSFYSSFFLKKCRIKKAWHVRPSYFLQSVFSLQSFSIKIALGFNTPSDPSHVKTQSLYNSGAASENSL